MGAPLIGGIGGIRGDPSERDLVPVEKAAQLGAGRVPPVPKHDCPRRRRLGGDALQPADPLPSQSAELDAHFRCRSRDRVIFVSLDPHDARRLGSAKAERERRRERDRHLAKELAHTTSADDARDSVLERDRLEASFEDREQRSPVTRVHRVLAGHEPDVGGDPR